MKTYRYKINGSSYEVVIDSVDDRTADVTVNGVSYHVELEERHAETAAPAPVAVAAVSRPHASEIRVQKKSVTAPLPGVITSVKVKPGDAVKVGQVVATLEAMKMENDIESEYSGVVASVDVTKGDSILEGEVIVTIS